MLLCGVQDGFTGSHHPQVDHFVSVAAQYDTNDIFPDVVHIAFDRGKHDWWLPVMLQGILFFFLHEGFQVSHRLFHHPCTFHYLGQEHLSFAKKIADHLHSIHQRAFDDFQRRLITSPCLLGIFDDEIADTFDQCMLKSHIDTTLPPLKLSSCVLLSFSSIAFRKIEQFLRGIRAAVE